MKLVLGIMFGVLAAAAIALGIVFYVAERNTYEDLVEERILLEKKITLLGNEIEDWENRIKNPEIISAEMDSLLNVLDIDKDELEQTLSDPMLGNQISLSLSRLKKEDRWSTHVFQLILEQVSDSVFTRLASRLPLIQYDRVEGKMKKSGFELDITGRVQVPTDQ